MEADDCIEVTQEFVVTRRVDQHGGRPPKHQWWNGKKWASRKSQAKLLVGLEAARAVVREQGGRVEAVFYYQGLWTTDRKRAE